MQGDLNGFRAAQLSETECIFIPNTVTRDQLLEVRDWINDHWYFKEASLLVSIKPYNAKTTTEKKKAAKPIPRAFHRRLLEILKAGRGLVQLLKYKVARIQGIELAYLISCLDELRYLEKIRVIITADDIEKHKETYEVLQNNSLFELIECDSDEAIEEEYKMNTLDIKPDLDIMNPPYDGALHLDILKTVLEIRQPNSTVISIQPARWLEDPLASSKQGNALDKYKTSIVNKISRLEVINSDVASKYFNIMSDQDLGIYMFTDTNLNNINLISSVAQSCINKIRAKTINTISEVYEENKLDGWRVEIHKVLPTATGSHGGDSLSAKTNAVKLVNLYSNSVFNNGYDQNGCFWTEDGRAKNGSSKSIGSGLPQSIKTADFNTAKNLEESCRTNFYKNIIHMFKYDQNMPLRFLPYMGNELNPVTNLVGYESAWTDEAYCKFFDLDAEESKFMCRVVEDYRIKDFINYTKLN